MFSLFSHNHYLADLLDGFRDIHCHLLPAVDDGSPDVEHSLKLVDTMSDLGVRAVYMTPHLISGAYGNISPAELRSRFSELRYDGNVDLRLAAEYFVDDRFLAKLYEDPLTMTDRHILVEFSLNGYSINSFDMLFEANMSGFQIILAHPERYSFVRFDAPDKVVNLIRQYDLQLNLLSIGGFYGNKCRKLALRMLEEKLYTFIATDTHSIAYLDALKQYKVSNKIFDALRGLARNNDMLF